MVAAQPVLDSNQENHIRIESYWTLRTLTDEVPQPVVSVVEAIADKRRCTADQVLFSWASAKR